ncbi:MAG TPA: alpha/beta hydrolase [Flavobacterium sp.]|jgi:pimeloyl-ACP methyl ester carboxylesterase
MTKIPVYFVPGLAASSDIFENIKLPEDTFETFLLEWFVPSPNESLTHYVKRMAAEIHHEDPVLIGVSFGGIIVQEMAKLLPVRKVIIISSAKCNAEFPYRMRLAKTLGLYKILPTSLIRQVDRIAKMPLGTLIGKRVKLYNRFLAMRDQQYLDWAIKNIILWDRKVPDKKVIHIHGDNDLIFPARYLKNYISVKGGTHIMILNKFKWLNENLPKIILND